MGFGGEMGMKILSTQKPAKAEQGRESHSAGAEAYSEVSWEEVAESGYVHVQNSFL